MEINPSEKLYRALVGNVDLNSFTSLDDANTNINAFMRRFADGDSNIKASPEEEVFGLFMDAEKILDSPQNAIDKTRAREMLDRAVELDPHCFDAKRSLILLSGDLETQLDRLKDLVAEAEDYSFKKLGLDDIRGEDGTNNAWMNWQLRPYLRCIDILAMLYADSGRTSLAIAELEKLLDLTENDNQGVRYKLIQLYVVLEMEDEAEALYERFNKEPSCWTLLSLSILYYRRRETVKARSFLSKLYSYCPASKDALTSGALRDYLQSLNDYDPPYYTPAGEGEFALALMDLSDLLYIVPTYLDWAAGQMKTIGSSSSGRKHAPAKRSGNKTSTKK